MARAQKPGLVYLDTHIICWLYEGRGEILSAAAAQAIEGGRLLVSPAVDLELQFLHEIGRISKGPAVILRTLAEEIGLEVGGEAFHRVAIQARELGWTRDPFDRLIVAQTMLAAAHLVTKDQTIRANFPAAIW